jgi:hypothetical protein
MSAATTKTRLSTTEVRRRCREVADTWDGGALTQQEFCLLANVPYEATDTAVGQKHLVAAFVDELIACGKARWVTDQKRNRTFTFTKGGGVQIRGTDTGRVSTVDLRRVERETLERLTLPAAPHSGILIEQIVIACTTLLTKHGHRSVNEAEVRARVLSQLGIRTPLDVAQRLWATDEWANVWRTACSALGQYGFWWRDGGSMRLSTRMILTEVPDYTPQQFSRKVQTDTRNARRLLDEIKQQYPQGGLLTMVTRGD